MSIPNSRTPMTIEKASEYTGLSKNYLYKLIHERKFPSYKPDTSKQGKVWLCKEELDAYIFSNRRSTSAELAAEAEAKLNAKLS